MMQIIEAIPKDNLDDNLVSELERFKKVEKKYLDYQRAGALLRAKIPNFEENEIEIAFISKIEKLRGESNAIASLYDKDGILKEGTDNVLGIIHDFYSNLYKWEEEDVFLQNYFVSNINTRFAQLENDVLDKPLERDTYSTVSQMYFRI